jgi:hypothetical protein
MAQQPVLSALNPLLSGFGNAFLLKRLAHFSVADAKSSALLAKNEQRRHQKVCFCHGYFLLSVAARER